MCTAAQMLNSLNCPQQELQQYCRECISCGIPAIFQLAGLEAGEQHSPARCLAGDVNVFCDQSLQGNLHR